MPRRNMGLLLLAWPRRRRRMETHVLFLAERTWLRMGGGAQARYFAGVQLFEITCSSARKYNSAACAIDDTRRCAVFEPSGHVHEGSLGRRRRGLLLKCLRLAHGDLEPLVATQRVAQAVSECLPWFDWSGDWLVPNSSGSSCLGRICLGLCPSGWGGAGHPQELQHGSWGNK